MHSYTGKDFRGYATIIMESNLKLPLLCLSDSVSSFAKDYD